MTDCTTKHTEIKTLGKRVLTAGFDGGHISSDAGMILLERVEQVVDLIGRAAGCFDDHRAPDLIEHRVGELLRQRVFGLCPGPVYAFVGDHLLAAELDVASTDASAKAVEILQRLVPQIRQQWRGQTEIVVRGDSGFCREEIMAWCEANRVKYVLGLARNSRLVEAIAAELAAVERQYEATEQAARLFAEFAYATRGSWSRRRRVVAKAEHLAKGANPRFVVTNLPRRRVAAWALYEQVYCARGEMENRIKEQQLYLFADRTSTAAMRSNQLRLWFSSLAYTLLAALRREGLGGTSLARARCDTIRLKLLKIGAAVRVTVRRVWVSLSSSYPRQGLFFGVLDRLAAALAARQQRSPLRL